MQVGDFVRQKLAYSLPHMQYAGPVIETRGEDWVKVLLTKKTTLGEQTHWFSVECMEVIKNANR